MDGKKAVALTCAGFAVAGAAGVADVGSAPPAAAHHADYCGHGIGPESYHDGVRYRSVYLSSRDTTGLHIHKYQQERFWNLAWYDAGTFEVAC